MPQCGHEPQIKEGVAVAAIQLILPLVALMLGVSPATAQFNHTLETSTWSSYVLGDLGKKVHDGAGHQASFTGRHTPSGCWGNVWGWRAFNDHLGGNYSEIDLTAACDFRAALVNVTAGISYFSLPPQARSYDDVVQPFVTVSYDIKHGAHTITPYASLKQVVPFNADPGTVFELGLRHAWKVDETFTLSSAVRTVYATPLYGNSAGWNTRFDVVGSWTVTKELTWNLGARYFMHHTSYAAGDQRYTGFVAWTGPTLRW